MSNKEEKKVSKEETLEEETPAVEEETPVVEETVEIKLNILEQINERLKKQDKDIKKLTFAADKARLNKWDQENSDKKLIKIVKVSIWRDEDDGEKKVILGWQMIKDDVYVDSNGKIIEDQRVKIFLYDKDSKNPKEVELEYLKFVRNVTKEETEVIKESKTADGDTFTVRLKDGQEHEIGLSFIN